MKTQVSTLKQRKHRKFLLTVPLLVLPFLTIIFWALGGGKHSGSTDNKKETGFNLQLPKGQAPSVSATDKMSYYDRARQDTIRLMEQMRRDPNYISDSGLSSQVQIPLGLNSSIYGPSTNHTSMQIQSKLNELNDLMRVSENKDAGNEYAYRSRGTNNPEIARLEQMMASMATPSADPEIDQLTDMLDKIISIQNPEMANAKLDQLKAARRGQIQSVANSKSATAITILDGDRSGSSGDGFFSGTPTVVQDFQNAIQAVVQETQTLVNGSTIKMRLLNEILIAGKRIPKNTFVYGQTSLNGERLQINVSSIRYMNSLYPVDLTVFDLDGLDGIRVPDAISRKVAKDGVDQSLQSIGLGSLNPSMGAQAADAGIEAVKSLFSKKTKLVRVTVKAGYKVLLHANQQNGDPADLIKF